MERLLRITEVSDRLGISAKTLRKLHSQGELVPVIINGQRRYREAVIENYLTALSDDKTSSL